MQQKQKILRGQSQTSRTILRVSTPSRRVPMLLYISFEF
jgi:hypothetical protein